jgi:hypothetical protein
VRSGRNSAQQKPYTSVHRECSIRRVGQVSDSGVQFKRSLSGSFAFRPKSEGLTFGVCLISAGMQPLLAELIRPVPAAVLPGVP